MKLTNLTPRPVLMPALFCLFAIAASVAWADEHHRPAVGTTQKFTQGRAVPMDRQTRRVALGKRADSETTKAWRSRNLAKVLRANYVDAPWVKRCAEDIAAGEVVVENCPEPLELELSKSSSPLRNATPLLNSSVGMLLLQTYGKEPMPLCTISLVAADAGLTAMHCWRQVHAGSSLKVFFQYEGLRDVDLNNVTPFEAPQQQQDSVTAGTQPEVDLVIMRFNEPYRIIKPEPVARGGPPVQDSRGIVMGYGFNKEVRYDHGINREATVYLNSCTVGGTIDNGTGAIDEPQLCFVYDLENPDSVAMMSYDSGGPMFRSVFAADGRTELRDDIIGVAKGGRGIDPNGTSLTQGVYLNLTDPFYQPWLLENIDSSGASASSETNIKKLGEKPFGLLSPFASQIDFKLEGVDKIPDLARELIITMNHQPGPEMFPDNLDLQVPEANESECYRLPTVEVCTIQCPQPGAFEFGVGWGDLREPDGTPFSPKYEVEFQMTAMAILGSKNDGLCTEKHENTSAVAPNATPLTILDEG